MRCLLVTMFMTISRDIVWGVSTLRLGVERYPPLKYWSVQERRCFCYARIGQPDMKRTTGIR